MTPPAARTLHARLTLTGWTATLTEGAGHVEVTTLGDPRSDGTRPRITVPVPCRSVAVRAHHPDGRALRVLWETHTHTAKGAPSWRLDSAWAPGEHAPRQLRRGELDQYIRTSGTQEIRNPGEEAA